MADDVANPESATSENNDAETSESLISGNSNSTGWTFEAKKKAVNRVKKIMPKNALKYAKVVAKLTTNVTPRKKEALKREGFDVDKSRQHLDKVLNIVKNAHECLKGRTKVEKNNRKTLVSNLADQIKQKYGMTSLVCKTLGIQRKYLTKTCNQPDKKRKDALNSQFVVSIQDFYKHEEISVNVPNKKEVKKDSQPVYVLQRNMHDVYREWIKQNPQKVISFSKFTKMKPKNVKTQRHRFLLQCLCEYCENTRLKLESLNRLAEKTKQPHLKLKDKYEAVNLTLCDKGNNSFHKLTCVQRNCDNCGTDGVARKLEPLVSYDKEVEWSRWDLVTVKNAKTGKNVKRKQLVKHRGNAGLLLAKFLDDLNVLSEHLFVAHWQQCQFRTLTKSFPQNSVVMTFDFAENYSCFSQNEIQSAHWAKDSVTIHPAVIQYHCQECSNAIIDEYVDIISDDLTHDASAVHTFMKHIFNHLTGTRKLKIDRAFILSDGCSSQYKSRVPFMDTSLGRDDFGIEIERGYYGSRHGKSRCDGEGGVLKSKASSAVRNNEVVITNAKEFFNFCKGNLEKHQRNPNGSCNHNRRTVMWVNSNEIIHSRPDRECSTVKGTRRFHSVKGISRGLIKVRNLSCYCDSCLRNDIPSCVNKTYIVDWKAVAIKCRQSIPRQPRVTVGDNQQLAVPIDDNQQPAVPVGDNQQPAVPVGDNQQPAVPVGDNQQPAVPVGDNQQPAVPINDNQQAAVPVGDNQKPAVPVGDNQQPAVPVDNNQQIAVTGGNSQQPGVPTDDNQLSAVLPDIDIDSSFDALMSDLDNTTYSDLDVSDHVVDVTDIIKSLEDQVNRYSVGTYVLVRHGAQLLPAVITRLQHPFFWIKFYSKKGSSWTDSIDGTEFTIYANDIEKILDPPDLIISGGSRFQYNFKF